MVAPETLLTARKPTTNCVPRLAIDPAMKALPPIRWQSLERFLGSQPGFDRSAHLAEGLCDFQSSETRLRVPRPFKLNSESLPQGGVENLVARGICKVGE